ncbi:angiotensin-converting enzyme-like [Artemia franciscana]|uniref:angiotensin-converting enzyme-like n=1 Tax=Artemia franciscana TaxID=6661 RepID=UPI0032DA7BF5
MVNLHCSFRNAKSEQERSVLVGFKMLDKRLLYTIVTVCLVSSTVRSQNSDGVQLSDGTQRDEFGTEEERAREFLEIYETLASKECNRAAKVEWNYATDITKQNEELKLASAIQSANFEKEAWINATSFKWQTFKDEKIKRQFKMLSILGTAALPEDKLKMYNEIGTKMETIYSSAKICRFNSTECGLSLEPEITEIMAKSRNYDELEHTWNQWHEMSGAKIRNLYPQFVELSNEAAKLNNYSDTAAMWMVPYESENFRDDIEELWQSLRPLYLQLHTYMRFKLSQLYGQDKVKPDEPIPVHLLGNMWAQQWNNLLEDTIPFPGLPSMDVTDTMMKKGYTPKKMFEVSEEFFTSLGLRPMTYEFWQNSVIEKPNDGRNMVCHASAWDFCDGMDFRIKQCTTVTMQDLITVHHEMGHIQYDQQYKNQPKLFRGGANPGFHEAIGDTLALSVATPKHLNIIQLLESSSNSMEADINALYSFAVEKIAFLPFAYLMDKWRWDVFEGKVKPYQYNCHWWKLREEYQGVKAPSVRSSDHFDPGAKYHIAANVEYLRYFVSFILQFQFHKSLCIEAGQYDPQNPSANPLHNCDIYKSEAAGTKLAAMLSLGASVPWPEALEVGTGVRKMDSSAFREYFEPLEKWLENENKKNNLQTGWKTGGSCKEKVPEIQPEPEPEPSPEPKPTMTEKSTIQHHLNKTKETVKDFFGKVSNKTSELKKDLQERLSKSSASQTYPAMCLLVLAFWRCIT